MINPFHFRPNLTSNWSLAIASFFIALAIWTIAKEDQLMEQELDVPVRFVAPEYAQLEVSPKMISVRLRFPVSQSNLLDPTNVWYDLGKQPGGDPRSWAGLDEKKSKVVDLESRNVILNKLLRSFQVVEIQPTSIMISGKLNNREARVEPNIVGTPGAGFVASRPRTDPPTLVLIGAPEDLEKMPQNNNGEVTITTDAIDINGQTDFYETRAEVQLPEGVELAEGQTRRVTVVVPISEEVGSKTILGIPVVVQLFGENVQAQVTPQTASVRVEGPLSLIESLTPADFTVLPKESLEEVPGADVTVTLDVQFSGAVAQRVRERVTIVTESLMPKSAHVKIMDSASASAPVPANTPLTAEETAF